MHWIKQTSKPYGKVYPSNGGIPYRTSVTTKYAACPYCPYCDHTAVHIPLWNSLSRNCRPLTVVGFFLVWTVWTGRYLRGDAIWHEAPSLAALNIVSYLSILFPRGMDTVHTRPPIQCGQRGHIVFPCVPESTVLLSILGMVSVHTGREKVWTDGLPYFADQTNQP